MSISIQIKGADELIKKLRALPSKVAGKILDQELRATAKLAAAAIKPDIPKDTGRLRRSITVRKVKSKRRYDLAYRIFAKSIPEVRYYAFAPNYGVTKGRGKQPAHGFMRKGQQAADAEMPATLKRIAQRIEQEWKK